MNNNESKFKEFLRKIENSLGLEKFDKTQKISLGFLSILSIVVIVLWGMQMRKNIVYPMYGGLNPDTINEKVQTKVTTQTNELTDTKDEALKTKDSDKDGLSDYDELNIFNTSAYLEDSDGDGFSDKTEIEKGVDPNCPAGKDCSAASVVENKTAEPKTEGVPVINSNLSGSVTTTNTSTAQGLTAEQKQALKKSLGENPDAKTLRELLLQSGADAAQLEKVDDAAIVKLFNEMIK